MSIFVLVEVVYFALPAGLDFSHKGDEARVQDSNLRGRFTRRGVGQKTVESLLNQTNSKAKHFDLHDEFFQRNCSEAACAASPLKKLRVDVSPLWARSSVTGKLCEPPVPLLPFNFVERYSLELKRLHSLMKCSASFAFVRYNDGERDAIARQMLAKNIYKDRAKKGNAWTSTSNAVERLRADVIASMRVADRRYILALPVPTCVEGMQYEYQSGGGNRRFLMFFSHQDSAGKLKYKLPLHSWSYSNLFTHRGGLRSIAFLREILAKPNTYVIANHMVKQAATRKGYSWAKRVIVFPMNIAEMWEGTSRNTHLNKVRELARTSGRTFIVAFGSVSKVFIHTMWLENKKNTYVDVGSLMEGAIGNSKARGWLENPCHRIGKYSPIGKFDDAGAVKQGVGGRSSYGHAQVDQWGLQALDLREDPVTPHEYSDVYVCRFHHSIPDY
eukprot:gene11355-13419_t